VSDARKGKRLDAMRRASSVSRVWKVLEDQRRAFGSFTPPLLVPGPDAARELTFIRSSAAVPVLAGRDPGDAADEDAYVSRTTVRSRPRNSAANTITTNTTTAIMPHRPPGKVRVVVVVVVTSVAVPVVVVVGAAWSVVVGWPVVPVPVACGLAFASVAAGAPGVVVGV
jgi:hypothetical protein